jgi:hypothetical protein
MRVVLFRIPAHISEASHAESSVLSLLFVKGDPADLLFSPFVGERRVDNDGVQPGNETRLPAESANVAEGAQHRFLHQVAGFICIRGVTARNAVQHLLVAAEQLIQSAGLSVLGSNDEFFIAALPAANIYGLEQSSRTQFARERQLRLTFQLHRILHMCPELAQS